VLPHFPSSWSVDPSVPHSLIFFYFIFFFFFNFALARKSELSCLLRFLSFYFLPGYEVLLENDLK
jgi:hypothetical protein